MPWVIRQHRASEPRCRFEWHLPCSADPWLLSLLPWPWQPHPVVPLCKEAEHCRWPTCIVSPWQQLFVWPSPKDTRRRGGKLNVFFLIQVWFWKVQYKWGFLTSTSVRKARRFRKDTWTGALSFSSAVSSRSFRADAAFRWSFLHLSSWLTQAYCTSWTTKYYNYYHNYSFELNCIYFFIVFLVTCLTLRKRSLHRPFKISSCCLRSNETMSSHVSIRKFPASFMAACWSIQWLRFLKNSWQRERERFLVQDKHKGTEKQREKNTKRGLSEPTLKKTKKRNKPWQNG